MASKYNHEKLEETLVEAYNILPHVIQLEGEPKLNNALTRLAIPVYKSTIGQPDVFRTPHVSLQATAGFTQPDSVSCFPKTSVAVAFVVPAFWYADACWPRSSRPSSLMEMPLSVI